MAAGGSAANTVFGIAQLGGHAALCGKVARDSFGDAYIRNMQEMTIFREDIEENLKSNGPNTRAHIEDFLAAVRSGGTPRATVDEGFHTAAACHMAVLSDQSGRAVTWDAQAETAVV